MKHSDTFILMMDMLSAEKTQRIFNDVGHSWKDLAIQMIIQEGVESSWLLVIKQHKGNFDQFDLIMCSILSENTL